MALGNIGVRQRSLGWGAFQDEAIRHLNQIVALHSGPAQPGPLPGGAAPRSWSLSRKPTQKSRTCLGGGSGRVWHRSIHALCCSPKGGWRTSQQFRISASLAAGRTGMDQCQRPDAPLPYSYATVQPSLEFGVPG